MCNHAWETESRYPLRFRCGHCGIIGYRKHGQMFGTPKADYKRVKPLMCQYGQSGSWEYRDHRCRRWATIYTLNGSAWCAEHAPAPQNKEHHNG